MDDPHPPAQDYVLPEVEINSFGDFLWWVAQKILTTLADIMLWLIA